MFKIKTATLNLYCSVFYAVLGIMTNLRAIQKISEDGEESWPAHHVRISGRSCVLVSF